ncbi:MAG: response regulator transcription factor [Bacteroidales bacterium]|jgi:two-component system alkaline phosphatase synthesis response regulator PhoP|nr:response regulator transcription factor [Bacteroidales bacterium]
MQPGETIRILLVDDEPDIIEFLNYNMTKEGYQVYTAVNGREAVEVAARVKPHLIVLDVMMPGMDGIETCEELRKNGLHDETIILFLTARSEDYSQIAGFNAGADDYVTKPVRPKVLISRISALLRRRGKKSMIDVRDSATITDSEIIIDRDRFVVICSGKELELPKKEFELLSLLMSKPGRVFTRNEILRHAWDENTIVGERTIDVHIRKLREKLGQKHIKTVKGIGYRFTAGE